MRYDDDTARDDQNRLDLAEKYIAERKWGTVRMIAGSIRNDDLKAQLRARAIELEAAEQAENAANGE